MLVHQFTDICAGWLCGKRWTTSYRGNPFHEKCHYNGKYQDSGQDTNWCQNRNDNPWHVGFHSVDKSWIIERDF